METILANVAVWGLGFALLNLVVTLNRALRDPELHKSIKVVVIIGAAILICYAFGIGGFALSLLLDGGTGTEMPPPS